MISNSSTQGIRILFLRQVGIFFLSNKIRLTMAISPTINGLKKKEEMKEFVWHRKRLMNRQEALRRLSLTFVDFRFLILYIFMLSIEKVLILL